MACTEAKIIHPDTQELLNPYKIGEMCIRGPQVFKKKKSFVHLIQDKLIAFFALDYERIL